MFAGGVLAMSDPRADADRARVRKLIVELEESGIPVGKLALLLHLHPTAVTRIKNTGRCEGWIRDMIVEIHHEYVPHETSQIVTRTSAMEMRTA